MQSELWRVGEYQVSGAANTICLEGADPVKLPPRLIDTLLYFARHAGEVISRKELVENVWNRSVVTDQTVTQNIFELRKFLRGGRDRLHAQEYILTKTMDTAKELLADPNKSVSDVAYALGYQYPQYFSKAFKRIIGCSPNEYRTS